MFIPCIIKCCVAIEDQDFEHIMIIQLNVINDRQNCCQFIRIRLKIKPGAKFVQLKTYEQHYNNLP